MMEELILKTHLNFHNQQIDLHGINKRALAISLHSQHKRFEVASRLFKYDNSFSIIDLGAGLCDFYPYLTSLGFQFADYTAVDINTRFLEKASELYPEINFIEGSVHELIETGKEFDYCVASGIYNLGYDLASNVDFVINQLKTLYPRLNKGLAVNFLSAWAVKKNPQSIYYDPIMMLNLFKKNFGSKIILYHNYLPHDFTIMVQK
jgi:SAM-dependent methyltransferase